MSLPTITPNFRHFNRGKDAGMGQRYSLYTHDGITTMYEERRSDETPLLVMITYASLYMS